MSRYKYKMLVNMSLKCNLNIMVIILTHFSLLFACPLGNLNRSPLVVFLLNGTYIYVNIIMDIINGKCFAV